MSSPAPGLLQAIRSYDRFSQALTDILNARIYGGMHYRNSTASARNSEGRLRGRPSNISSCLAKTNERAVHKLYLRLQNNEIMLYRMKGYGQFCPVALAAEIFAERWTPSDSEGTLVRRPALRRHPERRAADIP